MREAATSIVLILGQLATLAAAPLYVCTSADGTQRVEWGECGCNEHGLHFPSPQPDNHAYGALPGERYLAESPCNCRHSPLTNELRLLSRAVPDLRLAVKALHPDQRLPLCNSHIANLLKPDSSTPQGHTALADVLSTCLRC